MAQRPAAGSVLIWRNEHLQVFAFAEDGRRHTHARPARGLALKLDGRAVRRPTVRHFSVGVYGPVVRLGRGCWTWEAATWRTSGSGADTKRLTVKAFVRLKIGLGGRPRQQAT